MFLLDNVGQVRQLDKLLQVEQFKLHPDLNIFNKLN
jgi:hypothetical protein